MAVELVILLPDNCCPLRSILCMRWNNVISLSLDSDRADSAIVSRMTSSSIPTIDLTINISYNSFNQSLLQR